MWHYVRAHLRKELFCQTVYQNGFSSTDRAVHGAKALKNSFTGEVEPCQTRPKEALMVKSFF